MAVESRMLALIVFLGFFGLNANAQVIARCSNVTNCLACANSNFATDGDFYCSWCSIGQFCFDRYVDGDKCDPKYTIVTSEAQSRCASLFGLPLGYTVLIIIVVVVVIVIVIVVIILVRKRITDQQLIEALASNNEENTRKNPISVVSGENFSEPGSKSGNNSPRNRPRRGSRAARRKESFRSADAPKNEPFLQVDEEGKSQQDKAQKGDSKMLYVPPSLSSSHDPPGKRSSRTGIRVRQKNPNESPRGDNVQLDMSGDDSSEKSS